MSFETYVSRDDDRGVTRGTAHRGRLRARGATHGIGSTIETSLGVDLAAMSQLVAQRGALAAPASLACKSGLLQRVRAEPWCGRLS